MVTGGTFFSFEDKQRLVMGKITGLEISTELDLEVSDGLRSLTD